MSISYIIISWRRRWCLQMTCFVQQCKKKRKALNYHIRKFVNWLVNWQKTYHLTIIILNVAPCQHHVCHCTMLNVKVCLCAVLGRLLLKFNRLHVLVITITIVKKSYLERLVNLLKECHLSQHQLVVWMGCQSNLDTLTKKHINSVSHLIIIMFITN